MSQGNDFVKIRKTIVNDSTVSGVDAQTKFAMQGCSIIIPTFNRAELLRLIFCALADQTMKGGKFEIIVCDSNSWDATEAEIAVSQQEFPNLNIVHLQTANNVAAKRNLGILNAKYENLIFLDDDCIPAADFIQKHAEALASDSSSAVIYCGTVTFPSDPIGYSNYIRFRESRHRAYDNVYAQDGPLDYKTIVTMNMSVRKRDLESRGLLFDESFLGYGMEDNEFGFRAEKSGFAIMTCSALTTHHDRHKFGTFVQKIYQTSRNGIPRFLEKSPEAIWAMPFSRLLESAYPHTSMISRLWSRLFRTLLNKHLAYVFMKLLVWTDKIRLFYCPPVYRYVLAAAYMSGCRARDGRFRSIRETAQSWYV